MGLREYFLVENYGNTSKEIYLSEFVSFYELV